MVLSAAAAAWRTRPAAAPAVLVVLAAGLLLALTAWFPKHPSDEAGYLTLAHDLTHGQYTGLGWRPASPLPQPDPAKPDLWFGPGLPVVLAPLAAAGAPLWLMRLVGPLCLLAAALLLHRLLARRAPPRAALLAAAALVLYVPFYVLLPNLHSEPLAILLVVAVLACLERALWTGRRRYVALGGLAVGWLAVTRVEYGWICILALAGCLAWWAVARTADARRASAIFAAGLALCVPWLAFTYSVTKQPLVWGNSGPLSLWWMSSPEPQDLGDWRGGAHEILVSDPLLKPHRAYFRRLEALPPEEQNRRLEHAALANIRAHPGKFAKNVAANLSRMWFDFPFSAKPERLGALFYALPNALLLGALALSALLFAQARRMPVEARLFAGFGVAVLAVHAVVAAYPRMLMPLVPIAIALVTYAACVRDLRAQPRAPRSR
jgi:4-amino-4-deoxy-L-arabinose transferase-like glycosyltransferase